MASITDFDRDELLAKARARAGGLTELGPGPFLEGMDRFVDSLNAEARLNDIGRFIAEERVLLHVTNRLLYTHDREQHPEIAPSTWSSRCSSSACPARARRSCTTS